MRSDSLNAQLGGIADDGDSFRLGRQHREDGELVDGVHHQVTAHVDAVQAGGAHRQFSRRLADIFLFVPRRGQVDGFRGGAAHLQQQVKQPRACRVQPHVAEGHR